MIKLITKYKIKFLVLFISIFFLFVGLSLLSKSQDNVLTPSPNQINTIENKINKYFSKDVQTIEGLVYENAENKYHQRCQENYILDEQRLQKKEIKLSPGFPIRGNIPLPVGFKYSSFFEGDENALIHENIAPRLSITETNKLYLSCGKWLNQAIKNINEKINYSFTNEDYFKKYKYNFSSCFSFRQNVEMFYRKNKDNLINKKHHNIDEHKRIINIMKAGYWRELIDEVDMGKINKNHQLEWLPSVSTGRGLINLAIIYKAPEYVFEELLQLGVPVASYDISHAIMLSELGGGLNLLNVLHKNGTNIFEEILSKHSQYSTNLIEIISENPSHYYRLIVFLKEIEFDPNLISIDTKDNLEDAIHSYKQIENKDRSVIELLLDKGALVTQEHFFLSRDRELDNLLLKYKCD